MNWTGGKRKQASGKNNSKIQRFADLRKNANNAPGFIGIKPQTDLENWLEQGTLGPSRIRHRTRSLQIAEQDDSDSEKWALKATETPRKSGERSTSNKVPELPLESKITWLLRQPNWVGLDTTMKQPKIWRSDSKRKERCKSYKDRNFAPKPTRMKLRRLPDISASEENYLLDDENISIKIGDAPYVVGQTNDLTSDDFRPRSTPNPRKRKSISTTPLPPSPFLRSDNKPVNSASEVTSPGYLQVESSHGHGGSIPGDNLLGNTSAALALSQSQPAKQPVNNLNPPVEELWKAFVFGKDLEDRILTSKDSPNLVTKNSKVVL